MEYLIVLFRTLFFYVIITVIYRFLGKREVGELSIMDLIVSIFIAELAAIAIDNYKDSIWLSLLPMAVLVIIQICIARVSLKSSKVRSVIEGDPSVIINRGRVNFTEMLKQRYNLDDLLTQLRAQSIKSIEEVDYAILETSGKLSVFKKEEDKLRRYPLPVIIDGKIQEDTLQQINKSRDWLLRVLEEKGYKTERVFYAFYKEKNLFIIENKNIN